MTIDLQGDFDIAFEQPFTECPQPGMRDAINMWVSDDRGEVGLPRFAIEAASPGATGASENYSGNQLPWEMHDVQLNVAFPDGRVYRLREPGQKISPRDPSGRHSILGGGPLAFHCVEPFKRWDVAFRGQAIETTTSRLIGGNDQGPRVDLEFEIQTTMATPPYIQGSLWSQDEQARKAFEIADNYIGGKRFEQLFRAKGLVRVDGREYPFSGSGLRIRRKGIRHISGFWGHCWQSALFPSGKAFGCNVYPPRTDGVPSLNDGYLFRGDGPLIPARVVEAPWLRKLQPSGEDVSVVLETAGGLTTIEGETVVATFDTKQRPHIGEEFPVLFQGGVRYRWDGEETYGMLERSSRRDQIVW